MSTSSNTPCIKSTHFRTEYSQITGSVLVLNPEGTLILGEVYHSYRVDEFNAYRYPMPSPSPVIPPKGTTWARFSKFLDAAKCAAGIIPPSARVKGWFE